VVSIRVCPVHNEKSWKTALPGGKPFIGTQGNPVPESCCKRSGFASFSVLSFKLSGSLTDFYPQKQ
jgi:hypothetical protein